MPLHVLRHKLNRGLGETSRDLFEYVAEVCEPDDVIVRMDCDDTHGPEFIPSMIAKLEEGHDVVIASRFQPGGGQTGVSAYRALVSRCANLFMKVLFPIKGIREYSCGFRAYRAGIIQEAVNFYGNDFIQLKGLGFTCTLEKLVKLKLLAARITEVPFMLRYNQKQSQSKMVGGVTTLGYLTMVLLYYWPIGGWSRRMRRLKKGSPGEASFVVGPGAPGSREQEKTPHQDRIDPWRRGAPGRALPQTGWRTGMCGICGVFSSAGTAPAERAPVVRDMMSRRAHRGPAGEGLCCGEGFCFGHRRLAIIDVEGGAQPMTSEDGRYALTYNGEIYNYLELRADLVDREVQFRTSSDSEVLLQMLIRKGPAALDELNGMFAFAFVDRRTGEWLLARDPFGTKPLYYAIRGDELVFASEIKAILAQAHLFPR